MSTCKHEVREKTGNVQYTAPLRFEWRCIACGKSWYEEDPERLTIRECPGPPICPICSREREHSARRYP